MSKRIDSKEVLKHQLKIAQNGKKRRKKFPKLSSTKALERQYQRELVKIFKKIENVVRQQVIAQLPTITQAARMEMGRADSFTDDLKAIFRATRAQINQEVGEREIQREVQDFSQKVNNFSKANLKKAFTTAFGIDVIAESQFQDDMIDVFVANNVQLIQNTKEELLSSVEREVYSGVINGERHETIARQLTARTTDKQGLKGRFKKFETRAKFIARDQVQKLNSDLNRTRQESAGIDKYIWRTARDERVRDSHQLDGALFSWASGTGKFIEGPKKGRKATKPKGSLNPGDDFNCRCYAEPYIDDLLA